MRKLIVIVVCVLSLSEIANANNLARYLLTGRPSGHMGMYYQYMTSAAPSFLDANVSLAYQTQRLRGLAFGGSMWAATKLFQVHNGDFSKVKENYILTEAYASFVNPNRISMYAGRFKTDSEWIKHYTQGAAVTYEDVENLKVDFIWAWKNAYVTDYRMDRFRNPFGGMGAMYLGATITLPESPLQITPYVYAAPGDFTSFALKVLVAVPAGNAILYGKMHFLSFVSAKKDRVIDTQTAGGDGGFAWLEGGAKWLGLNTGGGVISVSQNGARGIDSFGQSSYFERREGLFYNNATTLYGFLEYDLKQYVQLDGAIRHTTIGSKNIFNWEVGITSEPQNNIKIGAKIIGMINNADFTLDNSIFAADGKNYLLTRVFGRVSF